MRLRDDAALGQLMTTVMDDQGASSQVSVRSRRDESGAVHVDISEVRLPAARRLMIELSALPTVDEVGLVGD